VCWWGARRAYRPELSEAEAIELCAGARFDRTIVEALTAVSPPTTRLSLIGDRAG
jgi:hypothetical protein